MKRAVSSFQMLSITTDNRLTAILNFVFVINLMKKGAVFSLPLP